MCLPSPNFAAAQIALARQLLKHYDALHHTLAASSRPCDLACCTIWPALELHMKSSIRVHELVGRCTRLCHRTCTHNCYTRKLKGLSAFHASPHPSYSFQDPRNLWSSTKSFVSASAKPISDGVSNPCLHPKFSHCNRCTLL